MEQVTEKTEKCATCEGTENLHRASQWLNARMENLFFYNVCASCCHCDDTGKCG